jgi:hypothetical protein
MRHATIQDAFDAASGVARQGLGFLTKEKEYELDTALFQQSIELEKTQKELLADYTRVDQGSGENVFQQNPEAYQKHVQERLAEWRKNAEAAGNGSRYFLDRLDRMGLQGSEDMRQRVAAAADEISRQREDVAFAKRMAAVDNAGWDIQKTLDAKMEIVAERGSRNRMNAVEEHKQKAAAFNASFRQALVVDTRGKSTQEALEELRGNLETHAAASQRWLAEGENLDSFLEGKEDLLKDAEGAIKRAIWNREKKLLDEDDKAFRQAAHDAAVSEDPQKIMEVREWYRRGVANRQAALGERQSEYDPEDRPWIQTTYPLPAGLSGDAGGKGSGSDLVTQATVSASLERVFEDLYNGRLGPDVSVHSLRGNPIIKYLFEEAVKEGGYKKGIEAFQYEFSPVLEKYFEIAEKVYNSDPLRKASTEIAKNWFKNNQPDDSWLRQNYPDYYDYYAQDLLEFHMDTVFGTKWKAESGETVLEALRGRVASYKGEMLGKIMTKKAADYSKPSDLSEALAQRDANTNLVFTTPEGRRVYLPGPNQESMGTARQNLEEINRQSAGWIEKAFGLDAGKLRAIEKETPDDADAETVFQYGASGEFYRVKGNKDGSLTIQKSTGAGGGWGDDKKITNKDAKKTGEGFGRIWRRLFGTEDLRREEAKHADKRIAAHEMAQRILNLSGTDGQPLPVPGFSETDKAGMGYFDRRRIKLEDYIRDNGMEKYVQWLHENHYGILPEELK